jgi:DNA-binding MarR family transcriptional regulator
MEDNREKLLKNLIENFTQIFRDMHKEQKFPFGDLVLTRQQMMIMFFINEKKGVVSAKEIAESLRVTAGAITQFIDGLVKNGLVERVESNMDKRSMDIKLTKMAKEKFDHFKKDYMDKINQAFNGLNNKELEQFIELTEKIKMPYNKDNKKS